MLLLIDTAGCGFEERQEDEGDSRSNPGEAKVRRQQAEVKRPTNKRPTSSLVG